MLDPTPPVCVQYRVRDGWLRLLDQDYQHDPTTVKVQWKSALFDLESLIDHYEVLLVDSSTGDEVAGPFDVSKDTNYAFSLLDLQHTQRVHTVVTAVNRAGVKVQCGTNGILVDLTPAEPQSLASNPVMEATQVSLAFWVRIWSTPLRHDRRLRLGSLSSMLSQMLPTSMSGLKRQMARCCQIGCLQIALCGNGRCRSLSANMANDIVLESASSMVLAKLVISAVTLSKLTKRCLSLWSQWNLASSPTPSAWIPTSSPTRKLRSNSVCL